MSCLPRSPDLLAGGDTPSEGHFSHIRVVAEERPSVLAALHHAEKPVWRSGLSIDFCEHDRCDRSHRRRLEHHGVPC